MMLITVSVFTLTGKSQDFTINPQKLIAEFKTQVMRSHKHLMYVNGSGDASSDVRFLYKGMEMDETRTLDDYSVCDGGRIQIILKTKPMNISTAYSTSSATAYGSSRRLSESLPIYERYAPSPMETSILSRSNSPAKEGVFPLHEILTQLREIREDVSAIKEELRKRNGCEI